MPEKFVIKTKNGTVSITRTKTKATVVKQRTCSDFGFKEKETIEVVITDETLCQHYAFMPEKQIIETFKNY